MITRWDSKKPILKDGFFILGHLSATFHLKEPKTKHRHISYASTLEISVRTPCALWKNSSLPYPHRNKENLV